MNEFDFIDEMRADVPDDVRIYVKKSMDILDRLHELMQEKGILQKELAEKMGKTEAEVSKWLNGVQNFTLKSLSKLEAALGSPIIEVPCKRNRQKKALLLQTNHVQVQVSQTTNYEKFEVAKETTNRLYVTAA